MSENAIRIARDHCLAPERVDAPIYGGRYRRLFEHLPPLDVDEHALHLLGRPGGPCDVDRCLNQIQVASSRLHNGLVHRLRADGVVESDVFEEARRATTWHYQHVILREFLPGLIGPDLTTELLNGGAKIYRADSEPFIP